MPQTRRSNQSPAAAAVSKEVAQTSRTLRKRKAVQTEPSKPSKRTSTRAKKAVPTYLERSQEDIDADPNVNLQLFCLPREIFDEIVAHLPLQAEACFSLTCKEALHAVGKGSWAWLNGKVRYDPLRESFIELLIRDIPGAQMCPICYTVHPPLKPPHAHRTTKLTKLCYGQDAVIDYWPQTSTGGYSLVYEHIYDAFQSRPTGTETSPPIELLAGDFSFNKDKIAYRMTSSTRWIERNLVITHEHRLRHVDPRSRLRAVDVTSLPLVLCAHLTTNTTPPPESWYTRDNVSNGPLLTHAIANAFPDSLQAGVAPAKTFRAPSGGEKAQMVSAETDSDCLWRCRSCPTKFRVRYDEAQGGELVVTSWHCFGKELYKAQEYWKWFVRREGPSLGKTKRNSEYYSVVRSLPDFPVE